MKAIVQFGKNITLEIDEKDPMDTLHEAISFGYTKTRCNVCQATEGFYPTTNKDKEGNTYINIKCKCGARSKLGRYKTGGFFWHDFEKYVGKKDDEE